MYEAFYGLREKPFSILPDPDLIYWGRAHRMAFSMLEFGVLNNAQFTVITGEVGSGKTTLVRHLLRKLDPRRTNVGLISNTPRGRDELLQAIMKSLNLPFEGSDSRAAAAFSRSFSTASRARGRRTVLIVDEAQNLGESALEGDAHAFQHQRRQAISSCNRFWLVSRSSKETLLRPELLQFAQRVSSDFHLKRFGARGGRRIYRLPPSRRGLARAPVHAARPACSMADASHGIPRMINILCDTALVYGYSTGANHINRKLMEEVIEDKRNFGIFPVNGADGKVLETPSDSSEHAWHLGEGDR